MSRRPNPRPEDRPDDAPSERARDELFDLLSHRHRRAALSILRRRDGSMHLTELARELAAREAEGTREKERRELQDRLYLSLCHRHVPRLAEAGAVEFDRKRKTVRAADGGPSASDGR